MTSRRRSSRTTPSSCGDKAVNQICRLAMERKLLGLRVLDLSGNGAISNSSLRLVGHVLLKHRESVLSLEIVGLSLPSVVERLSSVADETPAFTFVPPSASAEFIRNYLESQAP